MVLSGMSPVFVLWAIRGTTLIPDIFFYTICFAFAVLPNLGLIGIATHARARARERTVTVGIVNDRREEVITYLFAMLLPFYTADLNSWPNLWATVTAFILVVFLFWLLNLHHLNLLVVAFGYHCYEIISPESSSPASRMQSFTLLSKEPAFRRNANVGVYVITNSVFLAKSVEPLEEYEDTQPMEGFDDEL